MSQSLQPLPTPTPARPQAPTGYAAHRRLHEIYFPKPLQSVIRRERARADRLKGQFCLVMFRMVPAGGRFAMLRLSRIVLNEVRTTDEVGLYDRYTVCAILPDTAPDGAQKLVRRVHEVSRQKQMVVEPVVYTYPMDWLDRDDRGSGTPASKSTDAPVVDSLRIDGGVARVADSADTLPLEMLLARRPGIIKRALDVVVAGTALALASPVILAISAVIKFSDHGPILFRQWRSGLGGQPFQIYKFRTMHVGADKMKAALRAQSEQDGPAFKMTVDPRVTRFGRFLRKTSLDELPQLLNVVKGTMSLVGPRPLPIDEQNACDPWHRARLDVMPGLTCIWQVKGRSRVTFEEWMRMDLNYAHKNHAGADLKLMLQTIPAVLFRRGAK